MKRHILVDTMGLLMAVMILPADIQDRDGGLLLLGDQRGRWPRLQRVYADGGYAGVLGIVVKTLCKWKLVIVPRRLDQKGFEVLPKRWIVERTFAWLDKCRRLSKDYERLVQTSTSLIQIAMTRLMLRNLCRTAA